MCVKYGILAHLRIKILKLLISEFLSCFSSQIHNRAISLMGGVRKWSGGSGFNPRSSHSKELLSTQHYKVHYNPV